MSIIKINGNFYLLTLDESPKKIHSAYRLKDVDEDDLEKSTYNSYQGNIQLENITLDGSINNTHILSYLYTIVE